MSKYVAVGVLAMIVLAAITYEPPEKSLAKEAKTGRFQASYGAAQAAPPPTDPVPPPLPSGAASPGTTVSQQPAAPVRAPATAQTPTTSDGSYTVKKGQTLRDIAQEVFGDRERWKEIYEQNRERLPNPDTLREGMSVAYKVARAAADTATSHVRRESVQTAPPAPIATAARSYTVSKGDTLYSIARRELGSGSRWQEIVSVNSLPSEHVRAGTVLRLPQ